MPDITPKQMPFWRKGKSLILKHSYLPSKYLKYKRFKDFKNFKIWKISFQWYDRQLIVEILVYKMNFLNRLELNTKKIYKYQVKIKSVWIEEYWSLIFWTEHSLASLLTRTLSEKLIIHLKWNHLHRITNKF